MGDHSRQNTMNLDLNLEPSLHPPQDEHPHTMSFEDWLIGSMREVASNRVTPRLSSVWRHLRVPMGMVGTNMALGLTGNTVLPTDERNAAVNDGDEISRHEMIKTDENGDKLVENGEMGKEDVVKSNPEEGSFFDCNICLELASEPVVTCCGHLFCWPCLYQWLFVHSSAKECPICKGEVTMKTITPIYSRGNCTHVTKVVDSSVKIPNRPLANRIESWRRYIQRNIVNIPMYEMIRRIDNRFDRAHDPLPNNLQEISGNPLLNLVLTSRGMRNQEDTPISTPVAVDDTLHSSPTNSETGGSTSTLLYRRSNQAATLPSLTSTRNSADSYIYFHDHPDERNQGQHPLMDDGHSMSSIAAIIQAESQTTDTAAETDSRVSVSTVRRICESSTSRVSDIDSGESRFQRRRLQ